MPELNPTEREPLILLENTLDDDSEALLFRHPKARVVARSADEVAPALMKLDALRREGTWLAGYVAYEAGYALIPALSSCMPAEPGTLIDCYAFDEPERLSADATQTLLVSLTIGTSTITDLCLGESRAHYLQQLETLRQHLRDGDTYQVNYTLRLGVAAEGCPVALYRQLRERQRVRYSALMLLPERAILSLSPELFIRKRGSRLESRPMKGTAARGETAAEDAAIAAALPNDEKQRAENLMIVDLMRNDIGRLAKIGTMKAERLFEVETFETVHQMISVVEGEVAPDLSLQQLLEGLFPCGSITGAPKIRTMEIIRALEATPRGVYTGAIGYVTPDNDVTLSVPIRTLVIDAQSGRGELGIGGGITWASDPLEEWDECLLKARFLTGLVRDIRLIETCRLEAGAATPARLDAHLARMRRSAGVFSFPFDESHLRRSLAQFVGEHRATLPQKLRLTLDANGEIKFSVEALPVPAENATVVISSETIDADSLFRRHKTSRRELYNREFERVSEQGFYDVLVFNQHEELAEASRHNVLVKLAGRWLTPPVSAGALPGICRAALLAEGELREAVITRQDLACAEGVRLCNSVRGVVDVVLRED